MTSDTVGCFQDSEMLESSYEKAMRVLRSHVDPFVVDQIIEHIFKPARYQACACKYPENGVRLEENLVVLTAPTQNGKTKEMLALSWVGFFKHGLATYLFVRPDATAYGDLKNSVEEFNQAIKNFIQKQIEQNNPEFRKKGISPETYCLCASTLQQHRSLEIEDVVNVQATGVRQIKPVIRSRLLQAKNVENAQVLFENELALIVKVFGILESADRIKVIVIIDEAQNSRQTWSGREGRLENALFVRRDQKIIQNSARVFCEQHDLSHMIESLSKLNKPLRKIAALYVEVTATPMPSFLVEPRASPQILKCMIHRNYYGFGDTVWEYCYLSRFFGYSDFFEHQIEDDRKIKIHSFEDSPCLSGLDSDDQDDKELAERSCVELLRNAVREGAYFHAILYHRLQYNNDMCELAQSITRALMDEVRPLVIFCSYARNQNYGYGLSMFFNKSAEKSLKPHLIAAQSEIFINNEEYQRLKSGDQLCSKKPKVGEYVYLPPDFQTYRIFQMQTMDHGLVQGINFDLKGKCVAHLPSKMCFRVRTALTLIREACRLASVDPSDLLLVTIGKTLIREGLTVKTWSHELPPTIQLCAIDEAKFNTIPAVELEQALGRICGLRSPPYDQAPVLLVRKANVADFKNIVAFNARVIHILAQEFSKNPRMTIGEALRLVPVQDDDKPVPNPPQQLVRRKLQQKESKDYFDAQEESRDTLQFRKFLLDEKNFSAEERIALSKACIHLRKESGDLRNFEPSTWLSAQELARIVDYPKFESLVDDKLMKLAQRVDVPFFEKLEDLDGDMALEVDIEDVDEQAFVLIAKDIREGSDSYGQLGLIMRFDDCANIFVKCKCGYSEQLSEEEMAECRCCKWRYHRSCQRTNKNEQESWTCPECLLRDSSR